MSEALEELRVAILAVREAQVAQLEPGIEEDEVKFSSANRNLDKALFKVYTLQLNISEVPPGPLRDALKEISPYFVDKKSRWASESAATEEVPAS